MVICYKYTMKPSEEQSATISKKHIITIAGRPGSGKSTTAKKVADRLGYEHFSSGDLFREIAKKDGLDVKQANISAEKNSKIDQLVDERLQEIGITQDMQVIDSRMAWHWIPQSFKVFLDLNLNIAAKRIIDNFDKKRAVNESIPLAVDAYAKELEGRLDSEKRRYKALYGVNPYSADNYDLVVDTAVNNIEQVVEIVVKEFNSWLSK